jgi:hypothetical protein
MDRIAGIGHQQDVARAGDGGGEIGQPFLRSQGDDAFALGIDLDPEPALVIGRLGFPQTGNAARHRIAVRARIARRLDQLVDDMLRRRLIGVAHAEIDDVFTGGASSGLHRVDFSEDVRREALDAVKFGFHDLSWPYRWRLRESSTLSRSGFNSR